MEARFPRLRSFSAELRRRKVYHVGSAYLAVTIGATELFQVFDAPDWTLQLFVIVALIGFPVALVLTWALETKPETQARGASSGEFSQATPTIMLNPHASVRVTSEGSTRTFDRQFLIGRDPACDVHIDNAAVSRRHARVVYADNHWIIEDLGSSNGTWIDGEPIRVRPLGAVNEVRLSDDGPKLTIELELAGGARTERVLPIQP